MRLDKHLTVLASLVLALTGAGCVSRAEMDQVNKKLEGCERDKAAAQKTASQCEDHLSTETKRWDAIESQLTSTLPQTLKDFQDERARVIQIIPEQVRDEVTRRLDRYFVNVTKEFQKMETNSQALRDELSASRAEILNLHATTRAVGTQVDLTHKAVLVQQEKAGDRQRRVAEVIASIAEFDRERVNCKDCKDKVKLKGNGKEQLLSFHSELIQMVQMLEADGLPE